MIDLHTHTTCSDGTDKPFTLVKKALASGVTTLGITDHDSTAGWAEAITAIQPEIALVLGAEISCLTTDGISVHMLGALFERNNLPLMEALAKIRESRYGRMEKIVERLNEAGVEISIEEVHAQLSEGATLGRPHLADALVAKKIVKSREEAFELYLSNGSKYYVAYYAPTPIDAIRLIKEAGGVAVIAHPLASLRGSIVSIESFKSMVDAGMDGIEVSHRDQTPDAQELLAKIVKEYGIVATGSSDYHGTGKLNQLGEFTTTDEAFAQLESRADARRVIKK